MWPGYFWGIHLGSSLSLNVVCLLRELLIQKAATRSEGRGAVHETCRWCLYLANIACLPSSPYTLLSTNLLRKLISASQAVLRGPSDVYTVSGPWSQEQSKDFPYRPSQGILSTILWNTERQVGIAMSFSSSHRACAGEESLLCISSHHGFHLGLAINNFHI